MIRTDSYRIIGALVLLLALPAMGQNAGLSTNSAEKPGASQAQKAGKMVKFESATPNLIVSNIERSTAFYRDVLGFEQVRTVPEQAPFVFVWLKQGYVNVFLNVPQPEKAGTAVSLSKAVGGTNTMYIKMQGIDELAARVQKHGVTPAIAMHTEFYGMKEFAVLDPDGYLIIFAEPTPEHV